VSASKIDPPFLALERPESDRSTGCATAWAADFAFVLDMGRSPV